MSQDFLKNLFSRGSLATTFQPVISVGGVDNTSASLTYDVAHFSAGKLQVDIGGAVVNVSGGGGGPASQSGSWTVSVRDSLGNPVLGTNTSPIGTEAAWITRDINFGQARTTDPAPALANGIYAPLITDSLGKLVTLPGAINDLHLDGQVATPGVLAQTLIATPGAGRRIALQSIIVTGSASALANVIISGGVAPRTFGLLPIGYGGFVGAAGGAALYISSASVNLSVACDSTVICNIFASGYSLSN